MSSIFIEHKGKFPQIDWSSISDDMIQSVSGIYIVPVATVNLSDDDVIDQWMRESYSQDIKRGVDQLNSMGMDIGSIEMPKRRNFKK